MGQLEAAVHRHARVRHENGITSAGKGRLTLWVEGEKFIVELHDVDTLKKRRDDYAKFGQQEWANVMAVIIEELKKKDPEIGIATTDEREGGKSVLEVSEEAEVLHEPARIQERLLEAGADSFRRHSQKS